MSTQFKEVDFASGGHTLRGRFYAAVSEKPAPCIVMAHGTSGTFVMVIDEYADAFQAAGFNVLLYDHAGFGGVTFLTGAASIPVIYTVDRDLLAVTTGVRGGRSASKRHTNQ